MNRYQAFGLTIESDFALKELREADSSIRGDADIRIIEADLGRPMPPKDSKPVFDYHDPEGAVMIWPFVAGFRIRASGVIEVKPAADADPRYLAFPILGPVMAWMLHLRKLFVLHASSVLIDGQSFSFLGDKMAGKSTTAAAFLRAGGNLLTDDLLAIDTLSQETPLIQPAFAQLKLSEDAAQAIQVPGADALPLIMEGFEKRQHKLAGMHAQPVACDAIFVLKRGGDEPRIEWMDGATAVTALMRYSYNVRFHNAPIEMQDRQRHLRQCATLSKEARVGFLHVPADVEALQGTVEYVRQTMVDLTA